MLQRIYAVIGIIFPDMASTIPCYLSFQRKAKMQERPILLGTKMGMGCDSRAPEHYILSHIVFGDQWIGYDAISSFALQCKRRIRRRVADQLGKGPSVKFVVLL